VATARQLEEAGSEPVNRLTIEELAAETGLSVRNIRAHQARGLLAPPEVRMRVGYYGPAHVGQLRLIRELQDQGFNLNGIRRLLDDSHGATEQLLRVRQAITGPPPAGPAETLSASELGRRFRLQDAEGRDLLARAIKLGILLPVGGDTYEVANSALLEVADEAVRSGIPLRAAIDVLEEIQRHSGAVSSSFVKMFLREVWKPFAKADMPAERWPDIEDAVERLRPAASKALMVIFHERLSTQIDGAFVEITRRLSEQKQ
jgi:DNA-binding transcriptional MerR regulator